MWRSFGFLAVKFFFFNYLTLSVPNEGTECHSRIVSTLLTLPEHLSSPLGFSGVRVTRSLVLCVMFCRSLFVFLFFFLLAIVLSVLLLLAIVLSVLLLLTIVLSVLLLLAIVLSVLLLFPIVLSVLLLFAIVLSVLLLFAIVLSVLLRYTDSDYPFGIFKLFWLSTLLTGRVPDQCYSGNASCTLN